MFGRRAEVRDARDRYANLEVNHLLKRLEDYDGLVILATNAKSKMDQTFLRRMRFVLNFRVPDKASRAALWRAANAGSNGMKQARRKKKAPS